MPKKPKLPGAADFFSFEPAATAEPAVAETPPPETPQPVAAAPAAKRASTPRPRRAQPAARPRPEPEAPVVPPDDFAPAQTVAEGPTEKVTFYLNPMSLKRLELLKAQMLVTSNLKVSRSQIIDLLLEEGLRNSETLTQTLLERAG
ncbi:MAG TPA: hypothetical protein VGM19_12240 [Armatimonadota bacterium]|jgi:hypothetical protein